jgi:hypothetical protein
MGDVRGQPANAAMKPNQLLANPVVGLGLTDKLQPKGHDGPAAFGLAQQRVAKGPIAIATARGQGGKLLGDLPLNIVGPDRGYDTLGETVVVFTAGVGVIALLRRRRKKAQ